MLALKELARKPMFDVGVGFERLGGPQPRSLTGPFTRALGGPGHEHAISELNYAERATRPSGMVSPTFQFGWWVAGVPVTRLAARSWV